MMRSEELAFVNPVHEFNLCDDASGITERLKAKHGLQPKLDANSECYLREYEVKCTLF
jgi:hypothetical protein